MSDGEDRLWESFWRSAPRHGCTAGFPHAVAQAIAQRWRRRLELLREDSLLDVATGGGAVIDHAIAAGVPPSRITGVDRAPCPEPVDGATMLTGIDAAALPFGDNSFGLVTSQFGIEYAGWSAALAEAARVARTSLLVLAHHRDSVVVRHGREQAAQALAMAEDRALANAIAGGSDAARRLIDTLRPGAENHSLLDQMAGAAEAIAAMRNTSDVPAMIDHLDAELHRHAARMQAMAEAAIGDLDLREGTLLLESTGFRVATEGISSESGELVAVWVAAERPSNKRGAA